MELSFSKWCPDHPQGRFVLLHGMGGTGSLWRPVAALLEDRFSVLAPDQRGHGNSRGAISFHPLDYGQDVIDTMQKLQFYPACVVGHSMGVRTACAAAHLKPKWLSSLVLIDLGFFGQAGGALGNSLYHFLHELPDHYSSREEARHHLLTQAPDISIGRYLLAVLQPGAEGVYFPFDRSALIETLQIVRNFSIRPWVLEFAMTGKPVLVLRGTTSTVWSHTEFEKEKDSFKDLSNVRFHEVEGTGHGLPFEKRKELVEFLVNLNENG